MHAAVYTDWMGRGSRELAGVHYGIVIPQVEGFNMARWLPLR